MTPICSNDYYEIQISTLRNRAYLKLKGFWPSVTVVPTYVEDLAGACAKLRRGYTLLADLRQLKTPPLQVTEVHEEVQRRMVKLGLKCTAEILPPGILKMATNRYSKASQMQKQIFEDPVTGEKWLNTL